MIVVFEQDLRVHDGSRFRWKPFLFRGLWRGKPTWRFGWGIWSLSAYPEPGLNDFFEHVERTEWYRGSTR